ncbi:restriction endonuclease subunit S [Lactobacillus mulieris]|uniref:Restriction endonuclease subunit S n=1 Tax=Lactobacillus mulieris TaxID=2508708 RepID=A0AAW5WY59_9LACO|nr:restriction endonuclease subunit S [Lactobacillus mulieris]MCZ3623072.1 restriction endonuclease subunit S [Lactobacillus mulieris]MCZ3740822.1 restriction endonuclease subunit S [Lactobacillus mulieris]MCZ3747660.1 restriction endonuclease subunit S [Lactobacillus mulieris]MCZ9678306.1 restriction endonuclease subunit S [Lactobacillus mulieris]
MYPKVRFRGFDEPWKTKNVSSTFDIITDYVANGSFESLRKNVVTYKSYNYAYMIRLQDASNNWQGPWLYTDKKGYNFLSKSKLFPGDIVMSNVGSVGLFYLIPDLGKPMTLAPNSILLRSSFENNRFLFSLMNSNLIKTQIEKEKSPGAQPKINKTDFKKIKLVIPQRTEQNVIANLFKVIDSLLSLQQRKLELENELNRFYIGKIFANNNNYPELRFSSFNNSWEIAKLKEIITHKSGSPIEKYFSENGPLKVISIGSYGLDNSYIDQKIRAERNNVTEKYMVQKNDLTMVLNDKTSDCRILGRVLIINNDNEYVANQRTEIITPNKTVYPQFLYQLINGAFRTKIKKIAQGGTQIYVNFKSVEKLKLSIPEYEEQKDISKFLGLIKNKLSFEQSNVTITQQLKQFLLQNLFI